MPKLKVLSGPDVIRIFERFGFFLDNQKGSHVKLKRTSLDGRKQTLTIPKHDELDRGTLGSIFNQASRFLPENELREHFYTKE